MKRKFEKKIRKSIYLSPLIIKRLEDLNMTKSKDLEYLINVGLDYTEELDQAIVINRQLNDEANEAIVKIIT